MTQAVTLWLAGAIALSSAFIVAGWARAAWQHREPLSTWNAALMLAIGIDIGAISFAVIMGLRTWQLLTGALPPAFWNPWMMAGLSSLLLSKIILVWVASIERGRRHSWLWPFYWAIMAAWSLFCGITGV